MIFCDHNNTNINIVLQDVN